MTSRTLLVLTLLLAPLGHAYGQAETFTLSDSRTTPMPKSAVVPPSTAAGLSVMGAPTTTLPSLDVAALLIEDEQRTDKILRYGVHRDVALSIEDGKWHFAPDGSGRIWIADLVATDALGVRVHFTELDLPEQATVTLYSPNVPTRVLRYSARSFGDEKFWSASIYDEHVRIEYFLPRHAGYDREHRPFSIDAIQHHYRDVVAQNAGIASFGPPCHNDVTCWPSYENVAKASAGTGFIAGDSLFCCGTMLNSVAGDSTPYFMTANHCIDDPAVAQSVEVYWLYQTDICGGSPPSLATAPQSAVTTLLSTGEDTDYTLLMVEGTLPNDISWSGWWTGTVTPDTDADGVHHPLGTHKRVSFGTTGTNADPNFIRNNWYAGPTEPGSSGSGLFRSSSLQFVGQLSGGPSSCSSVTNDLYGTFSLTYPQVSGFLAGGWDDGYEPNASCGQAATIVPGTYYGFVVKSGDEDWYAIDIPAGETLQLTLDFVHDHGDVDVLLFDSCSGSLLGASAYSTDQEQILYTNSGAATTVYAQVTLFDDTRNSYDMDIVVSNTVTNDDCSNAIIVTDGSTFFDNTNATTDGFEDPSSCTFFGNSSVNNDLWYFYQPEFTGLLSIDLCASSFDTKVAVYHTLTCPDPDSAIACNDDACSLQSAVTVPVQGEEWYLIRVGGFSAATGSGEMVLDLLLPDDCPDAISVFNGTTRFSNFGATTDGPDEPTLCDAFGETDVEADVWFRYVATCDGEVTANLCDSNYDTKIAVYLDCPSFESAIACNDDDPSCLQGSVVTWTALSGQEYWLRIGGYAGQQGAGYLVLSCAVPNDDCVDAIPVTEGTYFGGLNGATPDGTSSCTIYNQPSVWYRYAAAADGVLTVSTCGSNDLPGVDQGTDTVLSVYTGCPGGLANEIDCNDDWTSSASGTDCGVLDQGLGFDSLVELAVVAGEELWIRVMNYPSSPAGDFLLGLELDVPACPPVENLTCSPIAGGVSITWSNPTSYDEVEFFIDGAPISSYAGGTQFLGYYPPNPGDYTLGIRGVCASGASNLVECTVTIDCPPVTDLTCNVTSADVQLDWVNAGSYQEIVIVRAGVVIAQLDGGATNFVDPDPLVGTNSYWVVAQCLLFDATTTSCSVTFDPGTQFIRGDCNNDGATQISDAVRLLEFLFLPGSAPLECPLACDANDDGTVNVADGVYELGALFQGTDPIPAPAGSCGEDPTPDALPCPAYTNCP